MNLPSRRLLRGMGGTQLVNTHTIYTVPDNRRGSIQLIKN